MQNKRTLVITSVVVILTLGVGAFLYVKQRGDSPMPVPTRGVNSVDYSGPTKQEQAAGDQQKQKSVDRDKIDSSPAPTSANIVIVDSSQYDDVFEVRSYVSNVFEDGGTCMATLTKAGNTSITATSPGTSSATNTQCAKISIPRSSFQTSGVWQLVVSYKSSTAQGTTTSESVTIK